MSRALDVQSVTFRKHLTKSIRRFCGHLALAKNLALPSLQSCICSIQGVLGPKLDQLSLDGLKHRQWVVWDRPRMPKPSPHIFPSIQSTHPIPVGTSKRLLVSSMSEKSKRVAPFLAASALTSGRKEWAWPSFCLTHNMAFLSKPHENPKPINSRHIKIPTRNATWRPSTQLPDVLSSPNCQIAIPRDGLPIHGDHPAIRVWLSRRASRFLPRTELYLCLAYFDIRLSAY